MTEALAAMNQKLLRALELRGLVPAGMPPPKDQLLSDLLVKTGRITPTEANQVLEEITGCQSVDPGMVSFTPEYLAHAQALIPKAIAAEEGVFPIRHEQNFVHLVMSRPEDVRCLKRMEFLTGSRIKPYVCHTGRILEALETQYAAEEVWPDPAAQDEQALLDRATKAVNLLKAGLAPLDDVIINVHVIKLLRYILNELVSRGSSDLHFEPLEDCYRIRYRKDGVMVTAWRLPNLIKEALTARLKLISGLKLDVTGMPQDGSIAYHIIENREIDVRVSTLPSLYGEKIVLRVLDKSADRLKLSDLGLEAGDEELLFASIRRPNGLLLVTGPTGSGKSTTLYAALTEMNSEEVNIVTAEDPVEYKLNGLTQVNCSAEQGTSFAAVIRSFLRQDPDIIMVGEIRDAETADFAVKAAMTGHLVLSTLHTNDAPSAINRLINMGLPPFLVASAQITVVAQRLVRRICAQCKRPYAPSEEELLRVPEIADELAGGTLQLFKGAGCEHCAGTGYSGRAGVYEIMRITDQLESMILNQESSGALKTAAVAAGMRPLRQAACDKLRQGVTTLDEVLRVTLDA